MTRSLLIALLSIALSSCAAPSTRPTVGTSEAVVKEREVQLAVALRRQHALDRRANDVAWPLLAAAADFCGAKRAPRFGFNWTTVGDFSDAYRQAATEAFGASTIPTVVLVVAASPAATAGLREGDRILAVDGQAAPQGEKASVEIRKLLSARGANPLRLRVGRGDQTLDVQIAPALVCGFATQVIGQDVINAYADGKVVYLTRGMMRFAQSDEELAVVIAHEIAHNAMGHIEAKTKNASWGMLFDLVAAGYGVNTQGQFSQIAAMSFSKDFELEADYVGEYILARAGRRFAEAAALWRAMGAEAPASIRGSASATHPSSPERFVALDNAAREIEAKLASGAPLVPETKSPARR